MNDEDIRGDDLLRIAAERVAEEVAEKKHGDVAARNIEQKYERLMESLRHECFLYTHDADGVFTYVSPAVTDVLGYTQEEFLRHHQDYETDNPINQETARHTALSIRGVRQPPYEVEVYHKDGGTRRLSVREVPVFGEAGKVVAVEGLALDITDHHQLKQQLQQAQKMEAVGQLAGGIAHDFNNLLTGIIGFSSLALDRVAEGSPVAADLESVREIAERAAALTQRLLAFSRRQPLQRSIHDINELVESTAKMLERLIGEDIELVVETHAARPSVRLDQAQFEQVLVNLAINARDAMPEGGRLAIETESVLLGDEYVSRRAMVEPGPYVLVSVTDSGTGMDQETRERVFEPFFSTKEVGRGTGLGLSMVYGIVKQHGGYVWVYSEPGRGTTLKLYFPEVSGALGATEQTAVTAASAAGGETVVVVEDEPTVLQIVRRTLEEQGYRVLFADNPAGAREIFRREGERVSLLLSDVVMPGGTGPELWAILREEFPRLRVLFMSGYTELGARRSGGLDPSAPFIAKPFNPNLLVRKVREVLDS